MSTDTLSRSFAVARAVMANIGSTPLDAPTPCASWDVRALLNHIIGGSHWFAATANAGAASPDTAGTEPPDFTAGDILAAYDAGTAAAVAAFGAPGALDRTVALPFGEFPGAVFMAFATMDHFAHAWDLAKATGQSSDLDPEFADQLLAQARQMVPDAMRGPDPTAAFGPAVEPPANASPADRYAAFLGRTP